MKVYLVIALLIFLTGGKSLAQSDMKLSLNYNSRKVVYRLVIPEKYKLVKSKAQNAELQEVENTARMKDSSAIYITDDLKAGGGINANKIEKYGSHYELKNYIQNDTATLYGVHNGKYWREKKYYVVVVGYYNVLASKVSEYDKIINSIIPQVDKIRKRVSPVH